MMRELASRSSFLFPAVPTNRGKEQEVVLMVSNQPTKQREREVRKARCEE
jgi:hypothetical protein